MGFGSYDESEQENQNVDGGEIETGDDTRTEYEGDLEFESEVGTDELLDQLDEIKGE